MDTARLATAKDTIEDNEYYVVGGLNFMGRDVLASTGARRFKALGSPSKLAYEEKRAELLFETERSHCKMRSLAEGKNKWL